MSHDRCAVRFLKGHSDHNCNFHRLISLATLKSVSCCYIAHKSPSTHCLSKSDSVVSTVLLPSRGPSRSRSSCITAYYALMASRVGMYLGSNSLQRPRSTTRGSHTLAFTTPRVKEKPHTNLPSSLPIGCSLPEARQRVDNLNRPSRVLVVHPLFSRMSYSLIPSQSLPSTALSNTAMLNYDKCFLQNRVHLRCQAS